MNVGWHTCKTITRDGYLSYENFVTTTYKWFKDDSCIDDSNMTYAFHIVGLYGGFRRELTFEIFCENFGFRKSF